jgi:hypothetical protein
MSTKSNSGAYSLDELQAHARKKFPRIFNELPHQDDYVMKKRRLRDLEGDEAEAQMLQVGHCHTVNNEVELWATNIRQPVAEDENETTGTEKAKGSSTKDPARTDGANKTLTTNLALYRGKQGRILEELDLEDPTQLAQIRYLPIYRAVADIRSTKDKKGNRIEGRKRLSVFVEYIFMLKGKSDKLHKLDGVDVLGLFDEGCKFAVENIQDEPPKKRKKKEQSADVAEKALPKSKHNEAASAAGPAKRKRRAESEDVGDSTLRK